MGGFAAISNRAHGQDLKKMMDQIKHRGSFMQGHVDLGHVLLAQNYHKADMGGEDGGRTRRCPLSCSGFRGPQERPSYLL
jgi:hypothetical protein